MLSKTEFNQTPQRINFSKEQQKILKFWQQRDSFKKQLQLTKDLPPFTFYDGPPFATGTPHYGHICAGTIKDVVCRYASQTGHYLSRRFGWDCHGLPVQYQIDKSLGIKDRRQILQMGIDKYNNKCRSIVMKYAEEWEDVVNRFGRWIDFKNDYKTMDLSFMESVWYVFKSLFDKNLVYRGRKIMPYSNAVHTVLSNFQLRLNEKQVVDPSLWVTFPLVKEPNVKLIAWTTTPWTLPSNLALAVNPDLVYVKIRDFKDNQIYIMADCRLDSLYKNPQQQIQYEILSKFKGDTLKGLQYVPIFDFFLDRKKDGCFKIFASDFVTSDSGTGIVHCAPGFGQQDYKLCVRQKIIDPDDPIVPLDEGGKFTKQVQTYEGVYVKDADKLIIADLKKKGRVFLSKTQKHSYPFCYRSDTPLIYKAVSAWFIKVTEMREDLLENNMKANWVPKNIQEKKFTNWLKDSQDWCFSRNRYWGNPIPLWVSDDGQEIVCIGSIKQLEQLSGDKITDLHRQHIDNLTIQSKKGKGKLKRIDQVFDCWFQSGSMPFAQVHYPFSITEQQFSKIFPADFIGEGTDQTRGWFYTLNVIATGIKNMNPYKNLIVNGLVLNQKGEKMQKRLKNYPDPMQVCNNYGADAVRLYLINSPLVKAEQLRFSQLGVKQVVKNILLPWYNSYRFLIQSIQKMENKLNKPFVFVQKIQQFAAHFNVTDRWIQSQLQQLIVEVRKQMQQYKLYKVVPPLLKFLNNLTNWYIRLNRTRLKGDFDQKHMQISINVLFDVLLKINILMSPIAPFFTDYMYQNLKKCVKQDGCLYQDSIHHLFIPKVIETFRNTNINQAMEKTSMIIQTARKLRESKKISLKQPIMSLTIVDRDKNLQENLSQFLSYIKQEINVQNIFFEINTEKYAKLVCLPNHSNLLEKIKNKKSIELIRKAMLQLSDDKIRKFQQQDEIQIEGQKLLTKQDLIINHKLFTQNLKEYEAVGGDKVIVLLDIRQDDNLKLKGYARQIISKIQKFKKSVGLNPQDQIQVLYRLGQNAANLKKAMEIQHELIQAAINKPLFQVQDLKHFVVIGKNIGQISQQKYEFYFTYPHFVFKNKQLQNQFGEKWRVLKSITMSIPFNKIKHEKILKIKLDEKQYEIELEKYVHKR